MGFCLESFYLINGQSIPITMIGANASFDLISVGLSIIEQTLDCESPYYERCAPPLKNCNNHGFVDGNKRVGTLAALVFRAANGEEAFPPAQALEGAALGIAKGEMRSDELTQWWRHREPGPTEENTL